jgi:predicted small secreted protein
VKRIHAIAWLAAASCCLAACYSSSSGHGDVGEDDAVPDVEIDTQHDPNAACTIVSGDFGDCEMALGYGFDGSRCRMFSGCDCAPHCGDFFEDITDCVSACADAGHCNEELLVGRALAGNPVVVGDYCDEIGACLDEVSISLLQAVFPDPNCNDENTFCDSSSSCMLDYHVHITEAVYREICEATLIEGVREVQCVVWGP